MGITPENKAVYRKGVNSDNPIGTEWVQVPGTLTRIDVDGSRAVGINDEHKAYISDVYIGKYE